LSAKYEVTVEVWMNLEEGIPKKLLSKNPGNSKTIEHLAETTPHKNTPLQNWDTNVCIMPCMDHMTQEPTADCLLVNMISTCMYHAIHGSHVRNRQMVVL
jgi:hypothetical protein